MMRIGILGSTRGTHLQNIMDAISKQELDAVISVVISNKEHAYILERARHLQLPAIFVDPKDLSREEYDASINAVLRQHQVDLIVLVGYMRILAKDFVDAWHERIINVHPSLLPAFAGKMDLEVHRAVIASGQKESGCTVHYVNAQVDAGRIILQKKCPVYAEDTDETLKLRVQDLERIALIEAIAKIIE
jgi:phosphoribosylglycinamide formyltransferase-1